ncbi:hypothetical protein KAT08_04735 [Candidatus Babeliales bacterium]|nr:hypothetical protein [Candidatus Babeliales bacterium]
MFDMTFFKKIFFCFLLSFIFFKTVFLNSLDKDFIKSFISHYEFSAEGRYAHEYHPFLLNKTAVSLDELEEKLKLEGLNLVGRLIICGYEEQAVPSYYTDYKKEKINDEMSSKSNVGWTLRLHNRFGFMTGFLFKDFNYFSQFWFKDKNSIFFHVDPYDVEIFDDRAVIFHEHTFGQALNLILLAQKAVIKRFKNKDFNGIFEELIRFWNCMYEGKIKFGNKQNAGTQDIIFSIEYAKHLIRSSLPIFNCYIGPDITYPIEMSLSQGKDATIHAQHFVKIFSKKLVPLNKKSTAYIFCSFVDGVGKSTLLGNTKNYQKYKDFIVDYERVDNSSSQLAEIFKLKDDVFIVDLPAQVSHFTYKPDGFVYVSVKRELCEDKIEELRDFVRKNKDEYVEKYKILLKNVKEKIRKEGYFSEEQSEIKDHELCFLKNVLLLKKEKINTWIPFEYDGKSYLFNSNNISQIRIIVSLGKVQSEGLKNIESEQMLFFEGIYFPVCYDFFLSDLSEKLKKNGVENIVFVDFISMYPRSSRENIRVNYLLQQMALLDSDFDSKYSLYADFVSGSQILSLMKNKATFSCLLDSFNMETLVRLILFKILLKNEQESLKGLSLLKVTDLIKDEKNKILCQGSDYLKNLVEKKLNLERKNLEDVYGLSKNFVNIQQFSFPNAILFCEYINDLFSNIVENERLNVLWEDPGKLINIVKDNNNRSFDKIFSTDKNFSLRASYCFDIECKDENRLSPFLRTLRSLLYASLSNLLKAQFISSDSLLIKKEKYFVPPVFLKSYGTKVYLLEKLFDEWEGKIGKKEKSMEQLFNLSKTGKTKWAEFREKPYRLDWKSLGTNCGIFAYDCDISGFRKDFSDKSMITFLVQKYQKEKGEPFVMSTKKLYKRLEQSEMWKYKWNRMVKEAKENDQFKKNGKIKTKKYLKKEEYNKKDDKYKSKKIFLGLSEQIPVAQLFVRMLATLEMIIKDPDSDIVIRFGNENDFKAALKLFEKVTLPKYYGILFEHDLFDDYDYVEPYPNWDTWRN